MNSDVVNLVDGLWRFGNNKVWLVQAGMIGGTVNVDVNKLSHGLDEFLDQIAEAATGSIVGLQGITWRLVGFDKVVFAAAVDLGGLAEDEMPIQVSCDAGLAPFLQIQYGLAPHEAQHAVAAKPTQHSDSDLVAQQSNGRQLRTCRETGKVRAVIDDWVIGQWFTEQIAGDTLAAMTGLLRACSATGED